MNSIFLIISALLPILTSTLESSKTITPEIGSLITGIEAAAADLIAEIKGGGTSVTATSLLAAISSALSVLQTQTTLNPEALIIANSFVSAAQAGLAASNIAAVDPTKLAPVTPV